MLISLDWLKDFIDINLTYHELAEKLTMSGFEVEGIQEFDSDVIFEINITPNRPDCLSILGIARELSILLNIPLKIPDYQIIEEDNSGGFDIEILAPDLCNRYTGRFLSNVNVFESPKWIKDRLNKCGIRSINNIVDITNYVLLEFGHPLHAFDGDTITNKKIKIDIAGNSKKIRTLDGIERDLPSDALLIWDDIRPIAIAGIMGGYETEVKEDTKNIFLESAYFNPLSIRKTSKKLNLKTESSFRFERGTDIVFLEYALNRATFLIKEITNCKVHKIIDEYPIRYKPHTVKINPSYINKLIGINLNNEEIKEIINRISKESIEKDGCFLITPPSFRHDIHNENDVAEEVARIYGYEKIPITMPLSPIPKGKLNKRALYLKSIKDSIRKSGFTEVINYSFMNISDLDMLKLPENDIRRNTIEISNPLSIEESHLRTTLIPSLLKNLKYNLDRQCKDVKIFEISRVFIKTDDILPREQLKISGLFYQDKHHRLWKDEIKSFYITKGTIEYIFKEFHIKDYIFKPSEEPFLHPGQSADIYISGTKLGFIGVLSPEIVELLDIKKQKTEIVVFEIDTDKILDNIPEKITYSQIPKYPYIDRDIAIIIDDNIPSSHILNLINNFKSEIIEDVDIFDVYKGPNIPQDKKSIGLSIVYRSKEKTLTEEEVDEVHASIINYLITNTGGQLRK